MKVTAELAIYDDAGDAKEKEVMKVEAYSRFNNLVSITIEGKSYTINGTELKEAIEKVL